MATTSSPSASPSPAPAAGRFLIVMGVSACGKSSVGEAVASLLAQRLEVGAARNSCRFVDADAYHPPANVAKMASGTPLTDEDRADWLKALAAVGREGVARGETVVLACSALKRSYRRVLFGADAELQLQPAASTATVSAVAKPVEPSASANGLIYLHGSEPLLRARIESRKGHFMTSSLLLSQLATLETPTEEELREIGTRFLRVDLSEARGVKDEAEAVVQWLDRTDAASNQTAAKL